MEKAHIHTWNKCLEIFEDNVDTDVFDNIFKPIVPVSLINDTLTIEVPTHFFYEYLEEHYLKLLKATFIKVIGKNAKLAYKISLKNPRSPKNRSKNTMTLPANLSTDSENAAVDYNIKVPGPNPMIIPGLKKLQINSNLDKNKNFENFVIGKCNAVAVNAGNQIAQNPGNTIFNPLFIHGPSGVGKTHLAHAIGLQTKQLHPDKIVLYSSSHNFQSQYTASVRSKNVEDFIHYYNKIDVLIIDDIQDLADKNGTQKVFFTIFNYLAQNKKQIIVTADRPPVELNGFFERLSSRFISGITLELDYPDFETRKKILRLKAQQNGIQISDKILDYIASKVDTNVRLLEGVLLSILAHSMGDRSNLTMELAKKVISNIIKTKNQIITPEKIMGIVENSLHITIKAMLAKTRKREVVQARHISMFLIKKYTKQSLSAIGQIFERDHATVIHAIKTVDNLCETDQSFKQTLEDIERSLKYF